MPSLDAWILRSPARALQHEASRTEPGGFWIGLRRPLLLCLAFGGIVSLATTGAFTLRLAAPASIYWSFVPIAEALAFAAVVWTRRRGLPFSRALDTFFAGHATWTLYLLALGWLLATLPPWRAWEWLTTWGIAGLILVIVWSAYVDVCFYRQFFAATRAAAIRDAVVQRLISWPLIFAIFAVPGMRPWGVIQEIAGDLVELLR